MSLISFIVPAHNEQARLGGTLRAISESARIVGQPYEIIVVDDASTDGTAEVARQHGVTVVPVHHRQIAATRNSGGRAARGDRLFFVDADTTVNARAIAAALRYMDRGAVGGGAPTVFDGILPLYVRLLSLLGVIGAKLVGFTGGAFMFCTREAFQTSGGFDERLYWAEEGAFALELKRQGRFAVLWRPVLTSGRRIRTILRTTWILEAPVFAARVVLFRSRMMTERSSVKSIWYESNRDGDDVMPDSLGARVSNGVMLLMTLVLVTGPVWNFIPWSWTPWASPLGTVRLLCGTVLSHAGLIFWPLAILLLVHLVRRRYWTEWVKLAALFAVCLWQAVESAQAVLWTWTHLGHWLPHFYAG